jgi:hypothetical protein
MPQPVQSTRASWRSDTLLIAATNLVAYVWAYWRSGWEIPFLLGYFCLPVAIISFVPAPREILSGRYRKAALVGCALSVLLVFHMWVMPCTGPGGSCK